MCWSKLLKTPLSTQTGSTFIAIAFEIPSLWGKAPPIEFNICIMHFSVSSQILISPSDGSLRPPFVFHATNKSGIFYFVVFNAAKHFMQWIFFSTIFTTNPATYDITASVVISCRSQACPFHVIQNIVDSGVFGVLWRAVTLTRSISWYTKYSGLRCFPR